MAASSPPPPPAGQCASFRPLADPLPPRAATVLGCAPSAGLYLTPTAEEDVVALLHEAVRCGITRFDTAPLYGCGRSELDIGRAFAAAPELMRHVTITTKVGRRCEVEAGPLVKQLDADPNEAWRVERDTKYYARDRDTGHLVCVADYTAEGFVESVRQSRERLGAEGSSTAAAAIEELRIHDVESGDKFAMITDAETGGVASLAALKRKAPDSGVAVRRIGLGMNDPVHILRMLKRFPGAFDSVLMAGAWNLMELGGYEVLRYCEAHGIEVHIAGVFGAGLLWGGDRYRYANAASAHLDRRDRILVLCKKHGVSLPWLAVHFATRPRCVTRLVFGCRTATELKQCSRLLAVREPKAKVEALYAALEAEGLLPRWTFAVSSGPAKL